MAETNTTIPKLKSQKVDRIALTSQSSKIANDTISTLLSKHPGISVNKKEFINWLVEDYFKELTPATEKKLFKKFYDEIKFLEKSIREVKKRKKSGEDISITDMLKQVKTQFKPKTTSRPKKANSTTETANSGS